MKYFFSAPSNQIKRLKEMNVQNFLCSYVVSPKEPQHFLGTHKSIIIDSGAFSAWNSGKEVDIEQYVINKVYELDEDGYGRREMPVSSGMKVAVVVDEWPRNQTYPVGHIVDVLGEPGENDTEMHAILAEYGLPYRFESQVANAADQISEEITEADLAEREDFRDTMFFTPLVLMLTVFPQKTMLSKQVSIPDRLLTTTLQNSQASSKE